MRVPDVIRDCVVFIGYNHVNEQGEIETEMGGTGFFMGVSLSDRAEDTFNYIVTAKHVIEDVERDDYEDRIRLRFNLISEENDKPIVKAITDECKREDWIFHKDSQIDVAIMPINPSRYDHKLAHLAVPHVMIVDDYVIENEKIGIGEEVYYPGLFTEHYGEEKNLPVIRAGIISSMPHEKIRIPELGEFDAYLIESRSRGGLSGSPVFVHLGGRPIPIPGVGLGGHLFRVYERVLDIKDRVIYLLGIIRGHWDEFFEDDDINMGVAMVIPAINIKEVLEYEELEQMRQTKIKKRRKRHAPVMDSSKTPMTKRDFEETLKKVSRPKKSDEGNSET